MRKVLGVSQRVSGGQLAHCGAKGCYSICDCHIVTEVLPFPTHGLLKGRLSGINP